MEKLMIDPEKWAKASNGIETNKPVGSAVDNHGTWFVVFVSTDKETGAVRRAKNGAVILNFVKRRPAQAAA